MRTIIFLWLILSINSYAQCPSGNLIFVNQTDVDNFIINYPNCSEINGNMTINGISITDLSALNQIESINGDFTISGTNVSLSLNLNNLNTVQGNFNILYNLQLTDLNGLNNLNTVSLNLWLEGNDNLQNLNGLNSLNMIGRDFQVDFNQNLVSLNGVNNLNSIGEKLIIYGNNSLNSISSLQNVSEVNDGIFLSDNSSLTSLNGLQNISSNTFNQLSLFNMSNLTDCDYSNFCAYLENSGVSSIYNNSSGCNSEQEILNTCGSLSLTDSNIDDIRFYPNPITGNLIYTNSNRSINYNIFNMNGVLISSGTLTHHSIKLPDLNAGMYILKLEDTSQTIKIVKL